MTSPSHESPVGRVGRISRSGAILPGRTGEVLVPIRGGLEAFLARDVDGGTIAADREVVVVEYLPSRLVLVTPLPDSPEETSA
jgi:hypothetical protein